MPEGVPQESVTVTRVAGSPEPAAQPDTKAVLSPTDSPVADWLPDGSLTLMTRESPAANSCADKVAELSLEANPAGCQLAKELKGGEEEDLSILKALSQRELEAYGPQSESGYASDDLCEDVEDLSICDSISQASDGGVSDTCSEEQEDFQAVRLAADGQVASKVAEDALLQDDWVFAEAEGFMEIGSI